MLAEARLAARPALVPPPPVLAKVPSTARFARAAQLTVLAVFAAFALPARTLRGLRFLHRNAI